jgi:uncharacterized protein YlxW (UPF0749 family)
MPPTDAYILKLLRKNAPEVLREIRQAAKKADASSRIVRLTLSQFEDNPLVLYAALALARTKGVIITFDPEASPTT